MHARMKNISLQHSRGQHGFLLLEIMFVIICISVVIYVLFTMLEAVKNERLDIQHPAQVLGRSQPAEPMRANSESF
jgi:competence protein ComGC